MAAFCGCGYNIRCHGSDLRERSKRSLPVLGQSWGDVASMVHWWGRKSTVGEGLDGKQGSSSTGPSAALGTDSVCSPALPVPSLSAPSHGPEPRERQQDNWRLHLHPELPALAGGSSGWGWTAVSVWWGPVVRPVGHHCRSLCPPVSAPCPILCHVGSRICGAPEFS